MDSHSEIQSFVGMEACSINNGMGSGTFACHQRPDDSYFPAPTDVDASKTSNICRDYG